MLSYKSLVLIVFLFVLTTANPAHAEIKPDLIGWTIIDVSPIQEDSGGGFNRIIIIQNGHIYKITGIGLPALPLTNAVVLGKNTGGLVTLKLLIGVDEYDAQQLR